MQLRKFEGSIQKKQNRNYKHSQMTYMYAQNMKPLHACNVEPDLMETICCPQQTSSTSLPTLEVISEDMVNSQEEPEKEHSLSQTVQFIETWATEARSPKLDP